MLAPETAAIRVHKYFKHLNTNVTRLEIRVPQFWRRYVVEATIRVIKYLYRKVHKSSSFIYKYNISNLKNSCDDIYLGNVFLIICDSWDWLMLPQGKSALKWFQRVTISNSVNLVILTSWSYSSLVSSEPPAPGTLVSSWHVMITDTPLIFTCRPAPGTRGPLIVILATEFTEDISTSERKQKTVCQLNFLRPLHHISVSVNIEQQTWCTKIHFVYCMQKHDFYMAIYFQHRH